MPRASRPASRRARWLVSLVPDSVLRLSGRRRFQLAHSRQLRQCESEWRGCAALLCFAGQINFQVPWATPTTGTVSVAVLVNGGSSNTAAVAVGTSAPGFFNSSSGAAIVQNTPDYSLNDASNPAPAGSTIVAYLTGTGPVSPAAKDGVPTGSNVLTNATSAGHGEDRVCQCDGFVHRTHARLHRTGADEHCSAHVPRAGSLSADCHD